MYDFLHNNEVGDSGKSYAVDGSVNYKKSNCVKVPKIYWDFTRTAVLTMEWIDGIKLTDEVGLEKAHLNRRELIDQVLYRNCSSISCFSFQSFILSLLLM